MREAVGGSLMLYLIIPIIILFIVFIGFIMNYAAAYRAANYVVSQIENCQGQIANCGMGNRNEALRNISETVASKYSYTRPDNGNIVPCYITNGTGYVYRVTLPVSFDLPIIGVIVPVNVKAETKTIQRVPSSALSGFSACS